MQSFPPMPVFVPVGRQGGDNIIDQMQDKITSVAMWNNGNIEDTIRLSSHDFHRVPTTFFIVPHYQEPFVVVVVVFNSFISFVDPFSE